MAPPLKESLAREALAALESAGGNKSQAAAMLGIPESTFYNRVRVGVALGLSSRPKPTFIAPELPSRSQPVEELLARRVATFQRKQEAEAARKWMRFKIPDTAPFGLAFVGDPHVDDDGADMPTLLRHVEVMERTPGLFGVGMGDWTNNWTGGLARLYAEQSTSKAEAWQLAEWLLRKSFWLLLLRGNHDMWSGAGDPIKWICNGAAPVVDWAAQFIVECGGKEWRISAAHDFPGNSMWNKLHALMREAKMSGHEADVYAAAHRHLFGIAEEQDEKTGRVAWLMRTKGYKVSDTYALTKGYGQQQDRGQTVTAIFNPETRGVRCVSDLEEAAEYLTWLRRPRIRVHAKGSSHALE
jgi:hypothetical protein